MWIWYFYFFFLLFTHSRYSTWDIYFSSLICVGSFNDMNYSRKMNEWNFKRFSLRIYYSFSFLLYSSFTLSLSSLLFHHILILQLFFVLISIQHKTTLFSCIFGILYMFEEMKKKIFSFSKFIFYLLSFFVKNSLFFSSF